jgi:hypothetical protein
MNYFDQCLSPEECAMPPVDLRQFVSVSALFERVTSQLGAHIRDETAQRIQPGRAPQLPLRFSSADIVELYPIVRHMNRIFFEQGTALSKYALAHGRGSDNQFFVAANESYKVRAIVVASLFCTALLIPLFTYEMLLVLIDLLVIESWRLSYAL